MPIIYSLVSLRGTTQAEATTPGVTGNFGEVAKLLVKKLNTTKDSKLSYIYDSYMFHYIISSQWIYLCICDQKYQRMLAFQFLNELMTYVKDPEATASATTPTAASAAPSSSTSTTPTGTPLQQYVTKEMEKYNSLVTEKHHKLYSDISDLKDTMVENIDKVLNRGEHIDLLVDKSEGLNETSFVFKKNSRKLRDEMWWRNTKLLIAIGGIGLFVLYLFISGQCGGITWPEC